ncbi:MAG: hypothetical protein ACOYVK_06155 [Bacillota bacterium]
MNKIVGTTPSLQDSKAVGPGEIQKVRQSWGPVTGQKVSGTFTTGNIPTLKNSQSINQQEIQSVRQKIQQSGNQTWGKTW